MFGDFGKMMKLLGQLKTKLPELQEQLASSRYSGESENGEVSATVNGRMQLQDVQVNSEAVGQAPVDPEQLAALMKAAVCAAQDQAAAAVKEAMNELTGGAEIPGLTGLMG